MGIFCETFGISKIKAPSTKDKRIQNKVSTPTKKPFKPSYPKLPSPKKLVIYKKENPSKLL